ncbi:MAG: DUF1848 domain-containing protein [Magnetospirillum sp.]|nr:DUF1848 domain-containing protein [Magnetospirillum sp.]
MIVSASYRTDIPAFYATWFVNRFRAGFAKVVNPYGRQTHTVALRAGVGGFVFWTRNVGPFREALAEVRRAGLPFVVQYTVTGYPRALESSVIEAERSLDLMAEMAATHGRCAVVWRYDPIVFSSLTPAAWHEETFARLAGRLEGVVDEVVISFANVYRKTLRNVSAAARAHRFDWWDPASADKTALAARLAAVAAARGMALTVCSQPEFTVPGAQGARCIDARRLEQVAAGWGTLRPVRAKLKGNRPGCFCFESRDIGEYDTCPHGCTYCYAVNSRTLAKRRFREHDPEGEFLFAPVGE